MCAMWDAQKGKPGVYRLLTSRPKSFCRNRRIPPCSGPKGTCETNRLSQKPKPGMKQTQGTGIVTTTVSNMYINIPNKLNYQISSTQRSTFGDAPQTRTAPRTASIRYTNHPKEINLSFFLLLGNHLLMRKESKHVNEGTHLRQMIMYTEFNIPSFPPPPGGPPQTGTTTIIVEKEM